MISGGIEVKLITLNLLNIRCKIWRRSFTQVTNKNFAMFKISINYQLKRKQSSDTLLRRLRTRRKEEKMKSENVVFEEQFNNFFCFKKKSYFILELLNFFYILNFPISQKLRDCDNC